MKEENKKLALGVGAGILIGKWGGSLAWWALGGATAIFILNSAGAQSAIKSGYASLRK
jgi:hypothetical protein